MASDGSADFSYIYDTSGDVDNYNNLSAANRAIFVQTVRKYFNDDPNEGFEYADFASRRYYQNFYSIMYNQAENEGFTAAYGRPPKNFKSPYEPFF